MARVAIRLSSTEARESHPEGNEDWRRDRRPPQLKLVSSINNNFHLSKTCVLLKEKTDIIHLRHDSQVCDDHKILSFEQSNAATEIFDFKHDFWDCKCRHFLTLQRSSYYKEHKIYVLE